ncbi:MAG: carbonic anhydrase [Planctomycetes bacterium]|nr:carbonic anhydrase [Planctomycetota bacterium]
MPIPELLAGWQRFRAGRFRDQRALFERIAREGQRPNVAMVACCDSRVDPAIVFDCDPGDLFLVRNVANLVPPYEETGRYHGTSAALEFAVNVLEVRDIVVLGHSQCGGIRALLEGPKATGMAMPFLSSWMSLAQEARTAATAASRLPIAERVTLCERLAIRLSVRNLLTFPAIRARVEAGGLRLNGWHFDLGDGVLTMLDESSNRFLPVDCDGAPEAAS